MLLKRTQLYPIRLQCINLSPLQGLLLQIYDFQQSGGNISSFNILSTQSLPRQLEQTKYHYTDVLFTEKVLLFSIYVNYLLSSLRDPQSKLKILCIISPDVTTNESLSNGPNMPWCKEQRTRSASPCDIVHVSAPPWSLGAIYIYIYFFFSLRANYTL